MSCLGRFKLQNRIHPIAVDAADKPLARLFVPGFIFPHAVPHDTTHGTDMLPGFLDVGYGCHGAPRLILYSSSYISLCISMTSWKLWDWNAPALIFMEI